MINIKKENLLPTKSTFLYEAAFRKFRKWCKDKNVSNYSENILLEYFYELANKQKVKCSTMWSQYSMIKAVLMRHGVDISKYTKLRAFLKKQNEGYTPKKSRVFTKAQIERFLSEAPDEKYLVTKVAVIIGVSGACRCDELVKMKADDIENLGSLLHVKIPVSKPQKTRSFTVVGETFLRLYEKYASLRPSFFNDRRFFLKYANGKCYRSGMGIHKIGGMPKEVASYLKLPHPEEYTGHSFRRTSATLLVNGEWDLISSKRPSERKYSGVAEVFLEESLAEQKETEMKNCEEVITSDLWIKTEIPEDADPISGSNDITQGSVMQNNIQSVLVPSALNPPNSNLNEMNMLLNKKLRIASNTYRILRFNVRVLHKNETYYAEIKITKDEIIIKPYDEQMDIVCFSESRLDKCLEDGNKGIKLELKFGKPFCKLLFHRDYQRDRAIKLIRTLMSEESGSPPHSMEECN